MSITPEQIDFIIKEIKVLNDDFTALSSSVAVLTERVKWLCDFFWVIITALVGIGVSQIYQIRIMKKNNKK